jgi:general L-amino acid transport system permease protein
MATVTARAPAIRPGPIDWARRHLFSTPLNAILTLVFGAGIAVAVIGLIRFLVEADFRILRVNLALFMVGGFPRAQLWRVGVAAVLLASAVGLIGGLVWAAAAARALQAGLPPLRSSTPVQVLRRFWPFVLLIIVCLTLTETITPTLVTLASVVAGSLAYWAGRHSSAGLRRWLWPLVVAIPLFAYWVLSSSGIGWDDWGGFMLNLFLTVAGIAFAFPFGVMLALGRRSSLPVIRGLTVSYIELIRGVPLITLLLMGVFALGFFLPANLRPSDVTRVLIAITLFEAAYIAEVIRGGLQAVPGGQVEAAQSLGLSATKTTRLIVLPQAFRATIPAMVGQFISLFKDTTLVAAVGMGDVLAASGFANSQPEFNARGLARITLPFVALAFWAGSYAMSREARRLERRLGVGER